LLDKTVTEGTKWVVYIHTFPNNKKYVGITSLDVTERWGKNGCGYRGQTIIYRAIKKYGWDNIKHEVVMYNLTEDEACKIETSLIKELNTTNRDYGYNILPGGKSMPITDRSKPVICLNTLEVFKSEKEATEKLGLPRGKIGCVCNGTRQHCGKDKNGIPLKFAHYEEGKNYERYVYSPPNRTEKQILFASSIKRKVICLNTLQVFDGVGEAAKLYNISTGNISRACKGNSRYAGKDPITGESLSWEYYDKDKVYEKSAYKYKNNSYREIICLNTLKRYPSISEAGRVLGIMADSICRSLKDSNKRVGLLGKDGYRYSFSYYDSSKKYIKLPLFKKYPSVYCTTLNKIYEDIRDAIKDTGIKRSYILDICNGKRGYSFSKSYNKKLVFKYNV
jgi:group I intron endonuclease